MAEVMKTIRQTIGKALSGVRAGDDKLVIREESTAGTLTVSSPAFAAGGAIPDKYTPQGANVSPPLTWTGVPDGTKELVLIVEDPDAPKAAPFVHWILHRLPGSTQSLPEGMPTTPEVNDPLSAQGLNDAKTVGYFGPQPPLGHGVHHYHFQLFALNQVLVKGPEATRDDLAKMMGGHILADGELVGTYQMKG